MKLAPALTAFGNTNPTSYFRLVPHQEAPTNICWGDRNRSVLVRVPLGWTAGADMCALANGPESAIPTYIIPSDKQTFEIRSADCSADIYQLLAALAVAVRHGFELENPLQVAADYYVDVDIHKVDTGRVLPTLPTSCAESADALDSLSSVFAAKDVFPRALLASIASGLRTFDPDEGRRALTDKELMATFVEKYFYCG